MEPEARKRALWIGIGVLVLALVVFGFWPRAMEVQTAVVERGRLEVIVEEEGRTQVTEEHVITAPVAAYMRRIRLEAGDFVEAGQPLVELEAPRAPDLDPRTREEARARVAAARARLTQAGEQARAARAAAERAVEERDRQARLFERGSATRQTLERAETEAEQAEANREAAEATVQAAQAELGAAEAALRPTPGEVPAGAPGTPAERTLTAPTDGQVLVVHRRSAGHVAPGEPILEIGDVRQLEVWTNVLSRDAMRIVPGTPVRLEQWADDGRALEGVVSRVDPRGFTEVSALGVEEQRVRVVADLVSPREEWATLGSGYRVLARFVVWQEDDVLRVPTGALFREADRWMVFVLDGGRAERRAVELGQRSGLAAQVLSGLEGGERVIVHPPSTVEAGDRVRPRR